MLRREQRLLEQKLLERLVQELRLLERQEQLEHLRSTQRPFRRWGRLVLEERLSLVLLLRQQHDLRQAGPAILLARPTHQRQLVEPGQAK